MARQREAKSTMLFIVRLRVSVGMPIFLQTIHDRVACEFKAMEFGE